MIMPIIIPIVRKRDFLCLNKEWNGLKIKIKEIKKEEKHTIYTNSNHHSYYI